MTERVVTLDTSGYRQRAWITVGLLFLVQTLNRADKAVLGLAATAIMADLALSPERFGLIASSFYFLYAATGIVVGYFVAPHFRPRWIVAAMIAVWSISQLPIVFAASFTTLLVGRIVLGMGEGNGTPTCINACHEWFAPDKRTLPTSVVMAGALVGSLASAPVLAGITARYGWHAAFAACAAAGGVMLVVWLLLSRDGPFSGIARSPAEGRSVSGRGAMRLLRDRTIYGCFAIHFAADWVVGFTLTWMPTFATKALGFPMVRMGWLVALVFLFQTLVMLGVAALSQALMARGVSSRIARGVLNSLCLLLGAVALVLSGQLDEPYTRLALVAIGVGLPVTTVTLNPALLSEVLPARHRNRLLHVLLSAGTIGSMLAPWLTGRLVGNLEGGNWALVLTINAGVLAVGGLVGLLLIRPEATKARLAALDAGG